MHCLGLSPTSSWDAAWGMWWTSCKPRVVGDTSGGGGPASLGLYTTGRCWACTIVTITMPDALHVDHPPAALTTPGTDAALEEAALSGSKDSLQAQVLLELAAQSMEATGISWWALVPDDWPSAAACSS
jgi:hypothetical protein